MSKSEVPLPPHVRAAKLRGDIEALRHFGAAGGRIAAENRRKKALAEKEKAERALAEEAKRDAIMDEILAEDYRQRLMRDAFAHAMMNLAGSNQD